jgi:hypothetical protein
MSTTPTSTEQKQPAAIRQWTLDLARSTAEFRVRHFWSLITVSGHFDRFGGTYTVGPDSRQIELTIDADSLVTGNRRRDKHLRSADFFHVAAHPRTRFRSNSVVDAGDGTLRVSGELEAAGKMVPQLRRGRPRDRRRTRGRSDDDRRPPTARHELEPAGHPPRPVDAARQSATQMTAAAATETRRTSHPGPSLRFTRSARPA